MNYVRQRKSKEKTSINEIVERENTENNNNNDSLILVGLVLFRILNSLSIATFFSPDEYWQSLEVAHNVSFGYGYLTWEWKEGLRSYLHPLIFSTAFLFLEKLGQASPTSIIFVPKVINGVFAGIGDYFTYKYINKEMNNSVARWSMLLILSNWFLYYCIVRSFSNSMETILTSVVLYYWPFYFPTSHKDFRNRKLAIFFACIAFIIRPTSAITWFFLGIHQIFEIIGTKFSFKDKILFLFSFVIKDVLFIGITVLGINGMIDLYFFGKRELIFVPFNFFKYNISKDIGSIYGTHPFHWYITQGYTAILGSFLPLFLGGIYFSITSKDSSSTWKKLQKTTKVQIWIICWFTGVLSFLSHKEFRFVLPILPLGLIVSGYCLYYLQIHFPSKKKMIEIIIGGLVFINLFPAFYLSCIHQRGSISVMNYIQTLNNENSVHFLMPCHSTPFYSHVHKNLSMEILDCAPSDIPNYIDEADQFKKNPFEFVIKKYKNTILPSHFVTFDQFIPSLVEFFKEINYSECSKFFQKYSIVGFPPSFHKEHIVVFCKKRES